MIFYFLITFSLSRKVLGVGKVLETILRHVALSNLNTSPFRATWTNFKPISINLLEQFLKNKHLLGSWTGWDGAGEMWGGRDGQTGRGAWYGRHGNPPKGMYAGW